MPHLQSRSPTLSRDTLAWRSISTGLWAWAASSRFPEDQRAVNLGPKFLVPFPYTGTNHSCGALRTRETCHLAFVKYFIQKNGTLLNPSTACSSSHWTVPCLPREEGHQRTEPCLYLQGTASCGLSMLLSVVPQTTGGATKCSTKLRSAPRRNHILSIPHQSGWLLTLYRCSWPILPTPKPTGSCDASLCSSVSR